MFIKALCLSRQVFIVFFNSSSPQSEYLSALNYLKIPLLEFVWDSEWNQLKGTG